MEGAPLPLLALDPDAAAHHLDDARADGEAEAGASEFTGRRSVGLAEGLEDQALLRLGDADAGVAHREVEHGAVGLELVGADADDDLARAGELHRVADEVDHDLAEPHRVADQRLGHARVDVVGDLQALLVRGVRQHPHRLGQGVVEAEGDALQRELLRFDLREIEDVVDDEEERVRRALHELEVVTLLARELGLEGQRGHADDPVHRRPHLVADVGEEVALGAARRLGRLLGALELDLGLLALLEELGQRGRVLALLPDRLERDAPVSERGVDAEGDDEQKDHRRGEDQPAKNGVVTHAGDARVEGGDRPRHPAPRADRGVGRDGGGLIHAEDLGLRRRDPLRAGAALAHLVDERGELGEVHRVLVDVLDHRGQPLVARRQRVPAEADDEQVRPGIRGDEVELLEERLHVDEERDRLARPAEARRDREREDAKPAPGVPFEERRRARLARLEGHGRARGAGHLVLERAEGRVGDPARIVDEDVAPPALVVERDHLVLIDEREDGLDLGLVIVPGIAREQAGDVVEVAIDALEIVEQEPPRLEHLLEPLGLELGDELDPILPDQQVRRDEDAEGRGADEDQRDQRLASEEALEEANLLLSADRRDHAGETSADRGRSAEETAERAAGGERSERARRLHAAGDHCAGLVAQPRRISILALSSAWTEVHVDGQRVTVVGLIGSS